ncbi:hypothetical protein BB561_005418 [Smittium simulii]|uniref:Uncharacterized protein n=1 Tax=Smittium simulii TaxID=133385 RepID=A0A2T9YAG9_9FUNG|nr:hypothetical protein BB561_005418 [Smittium simulii]
MNITEITFNSTEEFHAYLLPHFIDPSFPQVIRGKLQDLKQTGTLAKYISAESSLLRYYNELSDAEKHGTVMGMRFVQTKSDTNTNMDINNINFIKTNPPEIDNRIKFIGDSSTEDSLL